MTTFQSICMFIGVAVITIIVAAILAMVTGILVLAAVDLFSEAKKLFRR